MVFSRIQKSPSQSLPYQKLSLRRFLTSVHHSHHEFFLDWSSLFQRAQNPRCTSCETLPKRAARRCNVLVAFDIGNIPPDCSFTAWDNPFQSVLSFSFIFLYSGFYASSIFRTAHRAQSPDHLQFVPPPRGKGLNPSPLQVIRRLDLPDPYLSFPFHPSEDARAANPHRHSRRSSHPASVGSQSLPSRSALQLC